MATHSIISTDLFSLLLNIKTVLSSNDLVDVKLDNISEKICLFISTSTTTYNACDDGSSEEKTYRVPDPIVNKCILYDDDKQNSVYDLSLDSIINTLNNSNFVSTEKITIIETYCNDMINSYQEQKRDSILNRIERFKKMKMEHEEHKEKNDVESMCSTALFELERLKMFKSRLHAQSRFGSGESKQDEQIIALTQYQIDKRVIIIDTIQNEINSSSSSSLSVVRIKRIISCLTSSLKPSFDLNQVIINHTTFLKHHKVFDLFT